VEIPQVQSSPQFQYPSSVFSRAQPASQIVANEKFIPIQNLPSTLTEDSKVITLGDNPFVITSIKPKQPPSVQVVSSKKNPLESLRTEAIIEAILNAGKNDASRSSQIVVTTKSDVGRVPVTEAMPQEFSTTPVTEIFTESSATPTVTPTEQVASTTTPMPTSTTTTTPPPPPVHFEVTTTEERHYVSRKKKITIFIRVEDAGFDAEEKENYSTKQDFHEWTKTIIEPTDVFEEKATFVKNETREVEGPALGVDVTKVICRNFVDDKETVVELDALEGKAVCPKPVFSEGGSWEARAFQRADSEFEKKLRDIFIFPKSVGHTYSSQASFLNTPSPVSYSAEPVSSGFLPHSLEAIQTLSPNIPERHTDPVPIKRDAPKTKQAHKPRLIESQDLVAEASEVDLVTDSTVHRDDAVKTTPYMTSKREAKSEVAEMKKAVTKTDEVKTEDIKPKEMKKEEDKKEAGKTGAEVVATTPHSHIMVITRTPPVRPPNPYHHHFTTVLPSVTEVVPTKTEKLPVPQALSSSVERMSSPKEKINSHPEENKDRTFFRRST